MDSRSWLVWIGLMNVWTHWVRSRGVQAVPNLWHWGCCRTPPLDQVKESRPLATAINPTVQDPMNFPLVGVPQLDWWWRVYGSVGDLTRASGLQQRHMEHSMDA